MNTAPEECHAREKGFSGLNAMKIEGEDTDFDSLSFSGTNNTNSIHALTIAPEKTPIQDSNTEPSIPLPSPVGSRPLSPPISSLAPSCVPSPAPSPAASPMPSPAASPAPLPAISHLSLPCVVLSLLAGMKRTSECG